MHHCINTLHCSGQLGLTIDRVGQSPHSSPPAVKFPYNRSRYSWTVGHRRAELNATSRSTLVRTLLALGASGVGSNFQRRVGDLTYLRVTEINLCFRPAAGRPVTLYGATAGAEGSLMFLEKKWLLFLDSEKWFLGSSTSQASALPPRYRRMKKPTRGPASGGR